MGVIARIDATLEPVAVQFSETSVVEPVAARLAARIAGPIAVSNAVRNAEMED